MGYLDLNSGAHSTTRSAKDQPLKRLVFFFRLARSLYGARPHPINGGADLDENPIELNSEVYDMAQRDTALHKLPERWHCVIKIQMLDFSSESPPYLQ